jgi:serine/threonine-protein phosphatase PP1 catalytic subunit
MGNQSSKGTGTGTPRSASQTSLNKDDLQSYPSFSKADTKESTRSFRALKSKIPGSKTDSPRASTSGLSNGEESGRGSRSGNLRDSGDASPTSPGQDSNDDVASPDELKPPPSPIQSASIRAGHHDVDGMIFSCSNIPDDY